MTIYPPAGFKYIILLFVFSFLAKQSSCQLGNLIWNDEFNNETIDFSKWSLESGTGVNGDWGTGQLDRATGRSENVSIQNGIINADSGCLVITTRKEHYIDREYTSGRIRSAGKVSWGPGLRIVARIKPAGVKYQGQGFAFWMMPEEKPDGYSSIMWPQGGEIDIMEYVGSIPYNNLGTVHYAWFWENNEYRDWNHGHLGAYYNYNTKQVPNPAEPGYGNFPPEEADPDAGSSAFHIYGIDWYNNRIEFFIDDLVYHIHYFNDGDGFQKDGQDKFSIEKIGGRRVGVSEYSNHFEEWHPFEHEMYLILSSGVGGSKSTYGGPIVDEAEFPVHVYIDWLRVFTLNETKIETSGKNQSPIELYPNPANEFINYHLNMQNDMIINMNIYDIQGRKRMQFDEVKINGKLDISSLDKGLYIFEAQTNEKSYKRLFIHE